MNFFPRLFWIMMRMCFPYPNGNATERHLCLAYAGKPRLCFLEESDLRTFWSEKLGVAQEDIKDLPEGRPITDLIRAKTMKQGGVGYVKPDSGLSQDGRNERICIIMWCHSHFYLA